MIEALGEMSQQTHNPYGKKLGKGSDGLKFVALVVAKCGGSDPFGMYWSGKCWETSLHYSWTALHLRLG